MLFLRTNTLYRSIVYAIAAITLASHIQPIWTYASSQHLAPRSITQTGPQDRPTQEDVQQSFNDIFEYLEAVHEGQEVSPLDVVKFMMNAVPLGTDSREAKFAAQACLTGLTNPNRGIRSFAAQFIKTADTDPAIVAALLTMLEEALTQQKIHVVEVALALEGIEAPYEKVIPIIKKGLLDKSPKTRALSLGCITSFQPDFYTWFDLVWPFITNDDQGFSTVATLSLTACVHQKAHTVAEDEAFLPYFVNIAALTSENKDVAELITEHFIPVTRKLWRKYGNEATELLQERGFEIPDLDGALLIPIAAEEEINILDESGKHIVGSLDEILADRLFTGITLDELTSISEAILECMADIDAGKKHLMKFLARAFHENNSTVIHKILDAFQLEDSTLLRAGLGYSPHPRNRPATKKTPTRLERAERRNSTWLHKTIAQHPLYGTVIKQARQKLQDLGLLVDTPEVSVRQLTKQGSAAFGQDDQKVTSRVELLLSLYQLDDHDLVQMACTRLYGCSQEVRQAFANFLAQCHILHTLHRSWHDKSELLTHLLEVRTGNDRNLLMLLARNLQEQSIKTYIPHFGDLLFRNIQIA